MTTAPDTHITELDGLRGIAALIVVVAHCANVGLAPELFRQGFGAMGVTLFYGLSGFLMAYLYLHRPFNAATIRSFATSRVLRVLPLYFVCLIAAFVLLYGFGLQAYLLENPSDFISAALLVRARGVFWSIPVEMQFYVVFVGFWLCASRNYLRPALGAAAIVACVGVFIVQGGNTTILKWLHVFVAGMLIGVAFKLSTRIIPELRQSVWVGRFTWLLVALLPLCLPEVRRDLGFEPLAKYLDPITVGLPLILLFFGALGVGAFVWLKAGWLRKMGAISFGMYLLHMPFVNLLEHSVTHWGFPVVMALPTVLLATVLLATASLWFFERPFLALKSGEGRPRPAT